MDTHSRSFRLVCQPSEFAVVENLLEAEGFRFEVEPFSRYCRRLLCEPFPLGSSLAAFFGYIYIQDRASMLPPLALGPEPGAAVLDMAASPGSKSGFLGQLAGREGFVLANEPSRNRLGSLQANLLCANLLQCATSSFAGEDLPLPDHSWKYILLDPPCSGWGTARKHPQTLKLWQGKKIAPLIQLQRKLLQKAAWLLAGGGLLVYSTCTTNPAENEAQTEYAVKELGLEPIPLEPFAGFKFKDAPYGALLVDGESSESQGFYVSLLAQAENVAPQQFEKCDFSASAIPAIALNTPVSDADLLPPGQTALFGSKVRLLPRQACDHLPSGFSWQGFPLGTLRGEKFRPQPRLHSLLPPLATAAPRVVFEEIAPLRRLLQGNALPTDLASAAGLWWRELPLGIAQIKNGRLLASFR